MARKTKEDAEQTRQAILDSALQTFYEKGFSRTTFDEIARRINLTKGAVYWHFRNKAEVIAALVLQKLSEDRQNFSEVKPQTMDELRKAFISKAEHLEQNDNFRQFLFFIIYRMEWSEAVLNNVWGKIGEFCELPEREFYDCLADLQKKGEIRPDANICDVQNVLTTLWKGSVDKYIFASRGIKTNINLSDIIAKGFDIVMASVKVEKK